MALELFDLSEGSISGTISGPPDFVIFMIFEVIVKAKWDFANLENLEIRPAPEIINYHPNPEIILLPTNR